MVIMNDKFDLNRFVEAQKEAYEIALKEIKNGEKRSHWMWFIFPQFEGLGKSATSKKYSIKSKEEAQEYLKNKLLSKRLIEITKSLLEIEGKSAYEVLGNPDDAKLKSSMTLFHLVQSDTDIFKRVLDKFFDGKMSRKTSELINHKEKEMPNGGHICCMRCVYNPGVHQGDSFDSQCDIFGVKCSPHIICRSFREPKQSHWSARQEWALLKDLKPGIVYSVNNGGGPDSGTTKELYEVKKIEK
jgi:uncharacterized protein (DUF1810 family)